jgi:nucleotide-binding universal stress UspA family protein
VRGYGSGAMADRIRALIAYDGSEDAAGAIGAAGRLLPGAEAIVVHVRAASLSLERSALARAALPDSVIATAAEKYERAARDEAAAVAQRGGDIARASGLEASVIVQEAASAWRGICDAAAERKPDVVVAGSRGHGGLARAYLGSTSTSLIQHAPCPVLVAPTGKPDSTGPALIGFDGSEGARAAVRTAARLFADRQAVVVHAWRSPVRRSLAGSALLATPLEEISGIARDLDELFAAEARGVAEEGAALAGELGLQATARAVESADGAWRTLARAAESERAAVAVVGSRGHGALAATVLGSVSAGLVHNAALPVLVHRDREVA